MDRREFVQSSTAVGLGLLAASDPLVTAALASEPGRRVRFAQIADVHMVGFAVQDGHVCPRLPAHAWWALSRRYDLMGFLLPLALKQIREQFQPDFVVFTGDQVEDGNGATGQAICGRLSPSPRSKRALRFTSSMAITTACRISGRGFMGR